MSYNFLLTAGKFRYQIITKTSSVLVIKVTGNLGNINATGDTNVSVGRIGTSTTVIVPLTAKENNIFKFALPYEVLAMEGGRYQAIFTYLGTVIGAIQFSYVNPRPRITNV